VRLHVERHGHGPDLVLLHGWGLHSGAWTEAVPILAAQHRVHAVDLPGHGRSAAILPASFEQAAAAVAAEIPEDALVCGWSLGGLFAQHIAASGARLGGMALVSTTPCFVQRADWHEAMKRETLAAFAHGLHQARDKTLRDFVHLNALHGTHGREAIRTFTRRLGEHGTPSVTALEASLAWLRDTDLRARANAIACPTVVVHGARDALTPIGAARWLAGHIPGARLVEIDDAAHLPFFTHRDAFVAALEGLHG
jgi:pimeloyl-[acyl-carrier protein] methyl ester esterase